MSALSVAILTVSDTCSAGKSIDKSGPHLLKLLQNGILVREVKVVAQRCVPDEKEVIQQTILAWCGENINLILTTGGTGFAPRDVTPEATREILTKDAPGLTMAMMKYGLDITPFAMLSRGVCGVHHHTLIINLPGSVKGAEECLTAVSRVIPHAVDLLCDKIPDVKQVHTALQAEGPQKAVEFGRARSDSSKHSHHHHNHGHHCHHSSPLHTAAATGVESKVDVKNVAGRARSSPYPMVEVPLAQSIVLAAVPTLGVEVVKFRNACGRVLAQDVHAKDPLPPFPASVKDGYAVIAADGMGKRKVLGSSAAGQVPGGASLQPGQCVRITTGAAVPAGADCVVQVEDTTLVRASDDGIEELEIEILSPPTAGQDIRPLGSDIEEGQMVLASGSALGPAELGLLATVGATSVTVYRKPTVAILSTGNELQDPGEGEDLKPGHIRDSNKTTLLALLEQHSFPAKDMGVAVDEPQALLKALHQCLQNADVVVTTGGVSMGERDLLKNILTTDLNATIHFGRVAMKPGKPTTFATCDYNGKKRLIFGLPGNPVSATVTSQLFVLPALRKMAGHTNPMSVLIKANTMEDLPLDPRPEYHRALLRWVSGEPIPTAQSTGNQISSRLLSCHSANCLLILPPSSKSQHVLPRGTLVDCMLFATL